MKKLFSIILSGALMISMFGSISANADVIFTDSNTFYEMYLEKVEGDTFLSYRHYKLLDDVIYYCGETDGDLNEPTVIGIMPTKANSKVVIADEIKIGNADEALKVTAIDIRSGYLNANVEEIEMGDNITSVKGLNSRSTLKKVTLGKNVGDVSNSFNHCQNLELVIPEENKNFVVENNELYRITSSGKRRLVSVFNTVSSYEIKSGTIAFSEPFGKDISVKKLTINNNLGEFITGEMKALTDIDISKNVTEIKRVDISGAVKLKKFDLTGISTSSIRAKGARNLTRIVIAKNCKLEMDAFKGCKRLDKVTINSTKSAPKVTKGAFKSTKSGIKFVVKNKKVAKQLKKNLKNSGVKKAKIYVGKKLIYKNVE